MSTVIVDRIPLTGPLPEWDQFVEGTPRGDLVQSTGWATVKRELGASTHLVLLRLASEIAAGAVVNVRNVGPGLRIATVTKGPVLAPGREQLVRHVCEEVLRVARDMTARVLVVQAPDDGWSVDKAFESLGFRIGIPAIAPPATARVELSTSDEGLLAAMSNMRRRNIRAAAKGGFDIDFEHDVRVFHTLHRASGARQGFMPIQLSTLEMQWRHLGPPGHLAMLVARHREQPIAGLWLTWFAGTVTFKLPGWDASLPQPKHVNEALHWHAIRWARRIGARFYDFGGFDRTAAECIVAGRPPAAGFDKTPSYFKAGFGGSVELMPMARFRLLMPLVGRPLASVAGRVLSSKRGRAWIGRFRN